MSLGWVILTLHASKSTRRNVRRLSMTRLFLLDRERFVRYMFTVSQRLVPPTKHLVCNPKPGHNRVVCSLLRYPFLAPSTTTTERTSTTTSTESSPASSTQESEVELTTPMHDVVAPRILEEATTKGITWQGIKTFGGLHDGELIADDVL